MKTKKMEKKLNLNKVTIITMANEQLRHFNGGIQISVIKTRCAINCPDSEYMYCTMVSPCRP